MELLEPEMFAGVSDWYSDTSNNRTLIRGEVIHTDSQLYYGVRASISASDTVVLDSCISESSSPVFP